MKSAGDPLVLALRSLRFLSASQILFFLIIESCSFIDETSPLYVEVCRLMLDGRLSSLLTRSVHPSKIASLSVRRLLSSALSNVVAPELFVP